MDVMLSTTLRPENRLVADNLERQWNEQLARLKRAEEKYEKATKSDGPALGPEAKQRIQALASDLPRVWNDPKTPPRERKRMIRLLVEDVTLIRDTVIRVHIRWRGGATTSMELPLPLSAPDLRRTPAEIIEQVRALATEQTDMQIAETLNARWLRSGTGKSFTRVTVRHIRTTYGIDSLDHQLRRKGWLTAPEIARQLQVHPTTAKRFAREGVLRAVRSDDRGQVLFAPPEGPLPKAHPGKRFRDRRHHPKLTPHRREEVQYAG